MRARTLLVLIVVGLLALFVAVNWPAFLAPVPLSLVLTTVEAPLGLVMLGFTVALGAVLLAYALKGQLNALADGRRHSEELRRQRELADQAEASRFTDLRQYLEREIATLREGQQATEQRLREELTEAANSLAASIGVVDDRIERSLPTPPERRP